MQHDLTLLQQQMENTDTIEISIYKFIIRNEKKNGKSRRMDLSHSCASLQSTEQTKATLWTKLIDTKIESDVCEIPRTHAALDAAVSVTAR